VVGWQFSINPTLKQCQKTPFLQNYGISVKWKQYVHRLYTLVKGMLWSRRNISELLKLALQPVAGKPPPSQNKEQLLFDFD